MDPIEVRVPVLGGTRRLAAAMQGILDGHRPARTVVVIGGSPSSRLGPYPHGWELLHRGYRLIHFDRPGYGWSDSLPGRLVVNVVDDVAAIVDQLGLTDYYIYGRSGGGPGALACAAKAHQLGGNLKAVCVASGMAPRHLLQSRNFAGMTHDNQRAYEHNLGERNRRLGEAVPLEPGVEKMLRERALAIGHNSYHLGEHLRNTLSDFDWFALEEFLTSNDLENDFDRLHITSSLRRSILAELQSPDISELSPGSRLSDGLSRSFAEAVRCGADGLLQDTVALNSDWGFEISEASRVPVLFVYGERDRFTPLSHGEILHKQLNETSRLIVHKRGHFDSYVRMLDRLDVLTHPHFDQMVGVTDYEVPDLGVMVL